MRILSAVVMTCLCVGAAFGQANKAAAPPDNPCSIAPPSVSSCWDCFNNLLASCDNSNPQGARRAACYTAANNFFTHCLTRTPGGAPVSPKVSAPISDWNTLSGSSYAMITGDLEFDDVVVYVRDADKNGTPRQRQVDTFFTRYGENEVFISAVATVSVRGDSAGVVTVFLKDGVTVAAIAQHVPTVNGCDLNSDSAVDLLDLAEAMERRDNGQMTEAQFDLFVERFNQ